MVFDWKGDDTHDLGFIAEEVNEVTPLLATRDPAGEILGVKYDRITAVLVKGIQEQQRKIENLKSRNAALEARMDELMRSAAPPGSR